MSKLLLPQQIARSSSPLPPSTASFHEMPYFNFPLNAHRQEEEERLISRMKEEEEEDESDDRINKDNLQSITNYNKQIFSELGILLAQGVWDRGSDDEKERSKVNKNSEDIKDLNMKLLNVIEEILVHKLYVVSTSPGEIGVHVNKKVKHPSQKIAK